MKTKHTIDFIESEHVYLVDGVAVPSVTTILSPITASQYRAINPAVVEHARLRGEGIHELTQLIDYGDEPLMPYDVAPYVKAYLNFKRDYSPEWIGIEQIVYDEENNVCGTIDRYGTIDKQNVIVDIKIQAAPSVENKIALCAQTAEYSRAVKLSDARRYGLYLHSDETYNFFSCDKYEAKRNFKGIDVFDMYLSAHKEIERIKGNGKRTKRSSI